MVLVHRTISSSAMVMPKKAATWQWGLIAALPTSSGDDSKRGGFKSLKEERGAFCFLAGSGRLDCD